MLGKGLKRGLKIFFIAFTIVALALVTFYYYSITRQVEFLKGFISQFETGIALALASLKKISSFVLIETILMSVAFIILTVALIYFLNWYFIEKKNALVDELTEVYNRKAMNRWVKKEAARAKRFNHPMSVAMIDVDHFKKYNDINGHLRGDWLLRAIADILKKGTREMDFVGRYGGEEFIIMMPETEHNNSVKVLERIRKEIEKRKFPGGDTQPLGKVTISTGLVTFHKDFEQHEMIKKADTLLYEAKSSGRNVLMHKNYK